MIRDRLVVGIRDASLSEHLQLDADLTLEKAKKFIRQWQAVHEQQHILSRAGAPSLEVVHSNCDQTKLPGSLTLKWVNRWSHSSRTQVRKSQVFLTKPTSHCQMHHRSTTQCPATISPPENFESARATLNAEEIPV